MFLNISKVFNNKILAFFFVFISIFSLSAILLSNKLNETQDIRSRAQLNQNNQQVNYFGKNLSFLKLFGQKSVSETAGNSVTGHKIFHAAGVIVDKSSKPNKVYVVDGGNNRVLGFNGIGTCSTDSSRSCNVDTECQTATNSGIPSGICNIDGTKDADIVFGQADLSGAACNRDNNLGINKKPGHNTLCFTPYPSATNIGEYWMRVNLDMDGQGNLYVPDYHNNRVLKFNQPFSTDKTGGKGDTLADFVWGQDDFVSNGINRHGDSYGSPAVVPTDNRSLWISGGRYAHVSSRGVSVDQVGNMWVADTFNSRVLRFPPNSNTADLVLGEPDFNTGNCVHNGALNTMCVPTLAKIDPETGDLYVMDEWPEAFNARILVFKQPFTNGMTASKKIIPNVGPNFGFQSTGFVFNPYKQGEYAQGKLWVNEIDTRRTLLLDENGNVVKIINAKNITQRGGDFQYGEPACGYTAGIYDPNKFYLMWPGGSIGFDDADNIYLADEYFHRISRYKLPYDYRIINGVSCLPEPNGGMFKGMTGNIPTDDTMGSSVGLTFFDNQLIVKDERKLKIWKDYLQKPIGSAPDIVISQNIPSKILFSDAIDEKSRLWMYNDRRGLLVFQLPFLGNDKPLLNQIPIELYWKDTGERLNPAPALFESSIAFDKINSAIYLADKGNNRILRISNYNNFFNKVDSKLYVDMVIGQVDKTTISCNRGLTNPTGKTLCLPRGVKFDNLGNLYVIEGDYECHANNRISVFLAQDIKNVTGVFPDLEAKKVLIQPNLTTVNDALCAGNVVDKPGTPVTLDFNSRNEMALGNDGYYGDAKLRHIRQLWLYRDPLNKQTPDGFIDLPMGAPGEIAFDKFDNLFIQDHTWNKVWGINLDKDWLPPPTPNPTKSPKASVRVMGPNGGEKFIANNLYSICWTSSNIEQVEISLKDIKGNVKTIIGKIDANICYPWKAPTDIGQYKIIVAGLKKGNIYARDESDNFFTIVNPSAITPTLIPAKAIAPITPQVRDNIRRSNIQSIKTALESYRRTNGRYPTSNIWVHSSTGSTSWIPGLTNLPRDPINNGWFYDQSKGKPLYGYSYYTSTVLGGTPGQWYMLVAALESPTPQDLSTSCASPNKTVFNYGKQYYKNTLMVCNSVVFIPAPTRAPTPIPVNLLNTNMQNTTITFNPKLPNPNSNQKLQWFFDSNAQGTFRISGSATNGGLIQVDEYKGKDNTYVTYHLNNSTFTTRPGDKIVFILRKNTRGTASFTGVKLIRVR